MNSFLFLIWVDSLHGSHWFLIEGTNRLHRQFLLLCFIRTYNTRRILIVWTCQDFEHARNKTRWKMLGGRMINDHKLINDRMIHLEAYCRSEVFTWFPLLRGRACCCTLAPSHYVSSRNETAKNRLRTMHWIPKEVGEHTVLLLILKWNGQNVRTLWTPITTKHPNNRT